MATTRKIQLSTSDAGIYNTGVRADAAQAASEVLQEDLEKHHTIFNDQGFHNHIVHHILTIYSLGASPEDIRAAYDQNKTYQRPNPPVNENVVQSLGDKTEFKNYFGQPEHYHDFLAYFQQEIDKKGVNAVLDEYLFSGDECAEAMFVRLFSGTCEGNVSRINVSYILTRQVSSILGFTSDLGLNSVSQLLLPRLWRKRQSIMTG
ncbi:hypothetical protein AWENTII_002710 [Aspergillus wentii]